MIQLIIGRAGSGKTEFVFKKIEELIHSGEENLLLITPEQFSFVSERRLLQDLGEFHVNKVENTSFSRLCDEITKLYGGNSLPTLSKGSKAVMMKRAVEMVQDSLVLFHNSINSNSFINSVIKIYDEMKSCRVESEDFDTVIHNTDKELLKKKMHDISLIISAYDALISDEYYDPANELTRLYDKLVELDYFCDRTVFIDGFSGFVAQEYKILEVIIKQAKKVYITFCTDSDVNTNKFDLFSYVNSNISILKSVAKNINVDFENSIFLKENKRFHNNDLSLIEKHIFTPIKNKNHLDTDHVRIYASKGIIDECDWVALQIKKLLRKGISANEISVICRDLDKYQNELQFSFQKYNVPYFNDERQNISSQPLIMFVSFLLRVAVYSFRSEDIFSLLKTGLTNLDDDSINKLENYTYLWNISGSKWKTEFTQSTKGFVEKITEQDKNSIVQINAGRAYVIHKLTKFCNSCKGKNCKEICKAIYFTLIDFSCDEKLRQLAISLDKNGKSALAKEQGRVWDLLMEILDQLASVGGEHEISVKEFSKLFNLMISNVDLGVIPTGLDNVQIGSADRMRCNNPKAVFVVGANDGAFPQSVTSAGLLSELDRITLIENDFKLYSYGEILNAQEKYFAYMAVSAPTDYLFVSYNGSKNESGKSSIIADIESVFSDIAEEKFVDEITIDHIESQENAFEILTSNIHLNNDITNSLKSYFSSVDAYKSRLSAVISLLENHDILVHDKQLASDLFGKDMYLSASKVEEYFKCPFKYFCKFGLGALPRSRAELNPMQMGTVVHYVLEKIVLEKGSDGLTAVDDCEISMLVNKYLDEFLTTKMGSSTEFTPRFKYQFMRLSKMLSVVVKRLKYEFEQSDFEAKAFELKIGNSDEKDIVKSKELRLDDGGTISINGSIDRVDTFVENGIQYVRVVDYKSGSKMFELTDIMYGLNLQMFIYLFTLCQSEHRLSGIHSGVLYMHSARKIYSFDKRATADSIRSEENKEFTMKGLVLNDAEHQIAQHMEHDLKGEFIPVTEKKTESIVSLGELGLISKKIDSLITEMGNALHAGLINPYPIHGKNHDKTCEYCDYKTVCMNKPEIEKRTFESMSKSEVFSALKEGEENAEMD